MNFPSPLSHPAFPVILHARGYCLRTLSAGDSSDAFRRWAADAGMMHPMNLPARSLAPQQVSQYWGSFDNQSRFFFGIFDSADASCGFFLVECEALHNVATFQFFAEAGYAFAATGYTLEPFVGIDWTTLNMGAFREAGGSAALAGSGKRMEQATTTFGLALSVPMDGMITPSFRAGLQHAISNDTASRTLSFVSSGQSFTVLGTPLDADRAVIDANLGFNLGGARLTAGYSGTFGTRTTDNAIKAMAAVDF